MDSSYVFVDRRPALRPVGVALRPDRVALRLTGAEAIVRN
jgi:hypothetical protein